MQSQEALEADPFHAKGLQSLSHDLSGDPFAGEDPFAGGESAYLTRLSI